MFVEVEEFKNKNVNIILRCPRESDALEISKLREKIDGETEFLDREEGEGILSEENFKRIIVEDLNHDRTIFLVAEVEGQIVGYSRCAGKRLTRFRHNAEFGICILKKYWGLGIGKRMINIIIHNARKSGLEKIQLSVVEENSKAVSMYRKCGFREEGVFIRDRKHKNGEYYNTIIMGLFLQGDYYENR